jgi:hypothetical protein
MVCAAWLALYCIHIERTERKVCSFSSEQAFGPLMSITSIFFVTYIVNFYYVKCIVAYTLNFDTSPDSF